MVRAVPGVPPAVVDIFLLAAERYARVSLVTWTSGGRGRNWFLGAGGRGEEDPDPVKLVIKPIVSGTARAYEVGHRDLVNLDALRARIASRPHLPMTEQQLAFLRRAAETGWGVDVGRNTSPFGDDVEARAELFDPKVGETTSITVSVGWHEGRPFPPTGYQIAPSSHGPLGCEAAMAALEHRPATPPVVGRLRRGTSATDGLTWTSLA